MAPQRQVIGAVVRSALGARHCLVESPTGTGKTLSLMSAAIAAQRQLSLQNQRDFDRDLREFLARQRARTAQRSAAEGQDGHRADGLADAPLAGHEAEAGSGGADDAARANGGPDSGGPGAGRSASGGGHDRAAGAQREGTQPAMVEDEPARPRRRAPPRIIYATRTHSQVHQAVSELERIPYVVTMTVLGSRSRMCAAPNQVRSLLAARGLHRFSNAKHVYKESTLPALWRHKPPLTLFPQPLPWTRCVGWASAGACAPTSWRCRAGSTSATR